MTLRLHGTLARRLPRSLTLTLAGSALVFAAATARAQRSPLPRSRADVLLDAGLWPQAEEAYYAQSRVHPRDPIPRAALGRYLAMKGAVLPGTILIEEALKFGLDSSVAKSLLAPWREVLSWRGVAQLDGDSIVAVRPPRDSTALFQLPLPRFPARTEPRRVTRTETARLRDTTWADVVVRLVGVDSAFTRSPRVGFELFEGWVPSFDAATSTVTMHADPRSALRAQGRRYPVMRDAREVRVLMTSGRTLGLAAALRELGAQWWQLDLPHGVLVVR
jgi:hypothetical protein